MAPAESLDSLCDRRAARVAFNFRWVSSSSAAMRLRIPSSLSVLSSRRKCATFHWRTYSSRSLTAPTAYASAIEPKKNATRARTARFPPPHVDFYGVSRRSRFAVSQTADWRAAAPPLRFTRRQREFTRDFNGPEFSRASRSSSYDLRRTGSRPAEKRASALAGGNRGAGFCRTRGPPTAAADPG